VNRPFDLLNWKTDYAKIRFENSQMYGDAEPERPQMAATNVLNME
jgi:hypothetical protein